MKIKHLKNICIISLGLAFSLSSCSNDDKEDVTAPVIPTEENKVATPATYEFTRLGNSTVDYSGQTSRLNQLTELTAEMKKADAGSSISAATLKDMFANQNNPFSQVYSKDLKSKTFALDVDYFEDLMDQMGALSGITTSASNGTAGLMTRASGATILVDSNGRELTQLIEKGLMGATLYNQIVNTYLTEDKIGRTVDNDAIDTANGNYYTTMEHHFDEAFGYMGFPVDFSSNYNGSGVISFWGKYSNTADDNIQMNDRLMNAFKRGRAAITAKEYAVLDEEVNKLYEELEVMIAATTIYYINQTISLANAGDRHHALSEAYAFLRALRYSNASKRKINQADIPDMLENRIGNNFYNTTATNLNFIKNTLSAAYGLDSVKDQL